MSIDACLDEENMVQPHNGVWFSLKKTATTTWLDLQGVMVSERSQTWGQTPYDPICMRCLESSDPRQRVGWEGTGWGSRCWCLMGTEFPLGKMGSSGDGHTPTWTYLMPPTWTLKNGQDAKFMLFVLCSSENKKTKKKKIKKKENKKTPSACVPGFWHLGSVPYPTHLWGC